MSQQQPYGYRYAYSMGPRPSNGLGTAGMVLGIVGIVLSFVPLLGFVLGVLAITFGGIGLSKSRKGNATNAGVAITGLTLGILTLLVQVFLWMTFIAL